MDEKEFDEDSVVMEDEERDDESEENGKGPDIPHYSKREPYMEALRNSFHIPSEAS